MAARSYTALAAPPRKKVDFTSKSATALLEDNEDEATPPKGDWRDKRRGTIMRDTTWQRIQQRTFTTWFNDRLRGNLKVAAVQVEDLETDLTNGLLLIELLNKLAAPEKIGHFTRRPKMKVHCLENLGLALEFIRAQNIKLVNMSKFCVCTMTSYVPVTYNHMLCIHALAHRLRLVFHRFCQSVELLTTS